jgi:hypothetical protein
MRDELQTFGGEFPSKRYMRTREFSVMACSIVLIVVVTVPVFPQSNNQLRTEASSGAVAAHATVMHVYVPTASVDEPTAALPRNLIFPEMYRDLLEAMLQRSPTFRRQCLRLADAPNVTVRLQQLPPHPPASMRARTSIVHTDRHGVEAIVQIRPGHDRLLAELIGHELEHIVEQIDGVDLRAQSSLPQTGVHAVADGSFETIRAIRVGARVAREARIGR